MVRLSIIEWGYTMQYTITRENGTTICTVEQIVEFDTSIGWTTCVIVRYDDKELDFFDYNDAMAHVAYLMENE